MKDDPFEPPHGYDNERDVAEAKENLSSFAGTLQPTPVGERLLRGAAKSCYDLAISEWLAVKLIESRGKTTIEAERVKAIVHKVYVEQKGPPGSRSRLEDDESDALKIDDWLDGGEQWPRPLALDPKQNDARLTEAWLNERPSPVVSSDGELYSMNEARIWAKTTEAAIAAELRACDPAQTLDTPRLQRIARGLHVERHTSARPFDYFTPTFDSPSPENVVLFRDGFLNLESDTFRRHDGGLFITGLPDVDYDPSAKCPTWDAFLHDVLDPSFHPTLLEFAGYTLTPDTRLHRFLALIGSRRAGKSTIAQILSDLVGPSLTVSRTMHDLSTDFGLQGTLGARLLVVPDASDTEVSRRATALDRLKAITGGDNVSINRKGLAMIDGRIPAKLVLVANAHPAFLDESGALASRELLLTFSRTFEGREDRQLLGKLRDELPGIMNQAVAGLRRLRANGGRFTIGKQGAAAVERLREAQSPALRFANEHLEITGNLKDRVAPADLYERYTDWAIAEGLGARERRNRTRLMQDLVAALGHRHVVYSKRYWRDPAKPDAYGVALRGLYGARLKPILAILDDLAVSE